MQTADSKNAKQPFKALRDPSEQSARHLLLKQPHVAPLTEFVEGLILNRRYSAEANIPYFDPLDGGVDADVLILLEAPGPKAKSSGFVSRDNPDETAFNMASICLESQLPRERTVLWNAVPWYIGLENGLIRPATATDLAASATALKSLLPLLKRVNTIVLMGKKAARVKADIELWHPGKYRFVETPHPSPMCLNRSRSRRTLIVDEFQKIAKPH